MARIEAQFDIVFVVATRRQNSANSNHSELLLSKASGGIHFDIAFNCLSC